MAAQSLAAAAATAASDHKNRNLIIFAAAIFVRLPSLPFAVAIKNFYLICSSFQVLCSAAIASAASCSVPFFLLPRPYQLQFATLQSCRPSTNFAWSFTFLLDCGRVMRVRNQARGWGVWGLCDI